MTAVFQQGFFSQLRILRELLNHSHFYFEMFKFVKVETSVENCAFLWVWALARNSLGCRNTHQKFPFPTWFMCLQNWKKNICKRFPASICWIHCLEVAEVLDSPRYVCCEKSLEPFWLFPLEMQHKVLIGLSVTAKSLNSLEKLGALPSWTLLPFFKGLQKLQCRAGSASRKFPILKDLISFVPQLGSYRFSSGTPGLPIPQASRYINSRFLAILMYFKGWLSFNWV